MISRENKIVMTGSCFSTEIGNRLKDAGYNICLNPFGILFNPASIAAAMERLESGERFTEKDVIMRTDDAALGKFSYVSFSHHGSFARPSPDEFIKNANSSLAVARNFFLSADTIILTFGTAWVFRHISSGKIVANCHKILSREFSREMMDVDRIASLYLPIIKRHPEKRWIFTVSPIRHPADGLHGNQLNKATLLLAIEKIQRQCSENTAYFPSYEIMIDELRDHRYYASDDLHPSEEAVNMIFEKFIAL